MDGDVTPYIPVEGEEFMVHFENPLCQAPDQESWRGICGTRMKLLGERHPLWKAKHFIFECPKCEAIQAISEDQAARIARRR